MARSCLMAGAVLVTANLRDCCSSSRLCLFRGLFLPSLEFRQLLTMPWDGKCFRRLPTCGGYESVTVLFGSVLSLFRGVGTCPHSEWSEVLAHAPILSGQRCSLALALNSGGQRC